MNAYDPNFYVRNERDGEGNSNVINDSFIVKIHEKAPIEMNSLDEIVFRQDIHFNNNSSFDIDISSYINLNTDVMDNVIFTDDRQTLFTNIRRLSKHGNVNVISDKDDTGSNITVNPDFRKREYDLNITAVLTEYLSQSITYSIKIIGGIPSIFYSPPSVNLIYRDIVDQNVNIENCNIKDYFDYPFVDNLRISFDITPDNPFLKSIWDRYIYQ